MSKSELDKMMEGLSQAKTDIIPEEDFEIIEFPEPVKFKPGDGKAISLENQLDDYGFARNTLHQVIENGNTALKEMLRVACNSDHPRAFEVVSTLMKTLGDSSKDLLKLQEQMIDMRKKIKDSQDDPTSGKQEDGAFEGTLEDLLIETEESEKGDNEVS